MSYRVINFLKTYLISIIALCFSGSLALAATAATEPSLWADSVNWVLAYQKTFHNDLVTALKMMTAKGSSAAADSLIIGSFLYGIFHAAGPGHGKIVLTTYLLTHPHKLSQGIGIAAIGALCQGMVAIILVYGLLYLAGWVLREANSAVAWSERLSYLFMAIIGAFLILRIMRQEISRYFLKTQSAALHSHDKHTAEDCGHNHMPSSEQLEQVRGFLSVFSVVLAMGLRPCLGAVLVLALAKAATLPWAGVGAVIAMSAGTSITVATLAFLAVKIRHKVTSQITNKNPLWKMAASGMALMGGGLLLFIGISLLSASFHSRHPLGL
ncbi:MAG: nickel/cobalt transporter [Sneathiella sp.]|nr:nickel/cobalt transporter [Sneathiella sp.]